MSVFEFDNLDEAFDAMHQATMIANERLAEAQRTVTWGSHWVRFYDIPNRILIFGRVETQADVYDAEVASTPPEEIDEDPEAVTEEIEATMRSLTERHERGFMYGRCYSVIEPEGELGDTHRANLWPIPAAVFEDARTVGWQMDRLNMDSRIAISTAYAGWTRQQAVLSSFD